MDRNDRTRRQKQRAAAARRQNASPRRQQRRYDGGNARGGPDGFNEASGLPRQEDHAPLYDQDRGRPAEPPKTKRRGKRRHLYLTKKELRRRARRRRLLALLCVTAAIAAGILLSVTLLFKVTRITVQTPEGVVLSAGGAASASSSALQSNSPEAGGDGEPVGSEAGASSAVIPESAPPSLPPEGDTVSAPPEEGAAASQTSEEAAASQAPAETVPEEAPAAQPDAAPADGSAAIAGPYTEQEILTAFGVQAGENIFSFRVKDVEEQMALMLPLLEKIEVRRRYPGTVIINVTPAVATYCTQTAEGWLTLSASLKVMEITAEQPQGLRLLLCDAKATQPGTTLQTLALDRLEQERAEAVALAQAAASASQPSSGPVPTMPPDEPLVDTNRAALDQVLTALETAGLLADVTAVDAANPEEIAFLYQGRISVLLGTVNEMDYKMQFAAYILLNKDGKGCSETDAGVLDASHILSDGTIRPVFRQGTPELPSQKAAAQPADELEPAGDPVADDPGTEPAAG